MYILKIYIYIYIYIYMYIYVYIFRCKYIHICLHIQQETKTYEKRPVNMKYDLKI